MIFKGPFQQNNSMILLHLSLFHAESRSWASNDCDDNVLLRLLMVGQSQQSGETYCVEELEPCACRDTLTQPLPAGRPEDREGLGKRWLEDSGAGWAPSLLPSAGPRQSQEQRKQCYHLLCCFNHSRHLPPQDKYLTNCCLPSTTCMKGEGSLLDFWQGLLRRWHVSQALITSEEPAPPAVLCRAALHVGSKSVASGGCKIYCEEKAGCPVHTYVHCAADTHI